MTLMTIMKIEKVDQNLNTSNFRARYSCLQCEEGAIGSHCQKKRLKGKSGASEFGNKKWKIQSGQIWTLLLRNPRMLELGERDGSN